MDSDFMQVVAEGLASRCHQVVRFEFPYMASRRTGGRKRPPDREPKLVQAWREIVRGLGASSLVIGGKSLGGRIATLVAPEVQPQAVICLGYPFHPAGKPERLRTAHLMDLQVPTLIVQGERDALGNLSDVNGYGLPANIRLTWMPDGDHSLVPRKASGRTAAQNWGLAVDAIDAFLKELRS